MWSPCCLTPHFESRGGIPYQTSLYPRIVSQATEQDRRGVQQSCSPGDVRRKALGTAGELEGLTGGHTASELHPHFQRPKFLAPKEEMHNNSGAKLEKALAAPDGTRQVGTRRSCPSEAPLLSIGAHTSAPKTRAQVLIKK